MMLRSLKLALPFIALLPLVAACTAGQETSEGVSEAEANAAQLQAGTFKLYAMPNATPNAFCDVHTALTLSDAPGPRAKLEEALAGTCEIFVAPNPREYVLSHTGTSCGSRIFTGKIERGVELYSVTITDHRTRICRDLPPAKIIVEETRETPDTGPVTTTKYSHDRAGGCAYGGVELALGQSVPDADGCNTCTCGEHGVYCTELACAPPDVCRVGDQTYAVGDSFPDADGCNTCVCRTGGSVSCTELFCPQQQQ